MMCVLFLNDGSEGLSGCGMVGLERSMFKEYGTRAPDESGEVYRFHPQICRHQYWNALLFHSSH